MLPSILSSLLFHPLFQHPFSYILTFYHVKPNSTNLKSMLFSNKLYNLLHKPLTNKLCNNLLFDTFLKHILFYYLQNLRPDIVFRTLLFKQILICIKRGPNIFSFGSFLHILTILKIYQLLQHLS